MIRIKLLVLATVGLTLVFAGKTNKQKEDSSCLSCKTDSVPAEILNREITEAVKEYKTCKEEEIKQAQNEQNKLSVELGLLTRFKNKHLFLHRTDTLTHPDGGITVNKRYYWKYTNGKQEPYITTEYRVL
jgi:hypothetical protein